MTTSNAIRDLNGNLILASPIDEASLVHVTIIRSDDTFASVNLSAQDIRALVALLDAAATCAGCGHDAVPVRTGDVLHYECRRCGAEWDTSP